jgi:hypothetical protein
MGSFKFNSVFIKLWVTERYMHKKYIRNILINFMIKPVELIFTSRKFVTVMFYKYNGLVCNAIHNFLEFLGIVFRSILP